MMLDYAGASWERQPRAAIADDKTVFAVPAVRKGDQVVSQTTAAAAWLGEALGLDAPLPLKWEAMKLGADVADIWSEAYAARKRAKNWDEASEFIAGRLAKWFGCLEASAQKHKSEDKQYMLGTTTPTYVDFLVLNVVETCKFIFGADRLAPAMGGAPTVQAIAGMLAANEKVAATLAREPVLYASVGAGEGARIPF